MDLDTFGRARAAFLVDAGGNTISNLAQSSTNTVRLLSSAATTNATLVKGSAGVVSQVNGFNAASTARFLKLFDKATTPVPASDTPRMTFYLPPGTAFVFDCNDAYANGIGFAITGLAADLDNTSIAAADILCLNVDYR